MLPRLIRAPIAAPKNCKWSDDATRFGDNPDSVATGVCAKKQCPPDELVEATALMPEPYYHRVDPLSGENKTCDDVAPDYNPPGMLPEFHLCCEPPSIYTRDWPVLPSYLWSDTNDNPDEQDVTWQWADDFGNNNHDITPDNLDENPGADPYGFVMMDGPPGSIYNAFADAFTVVEDDDTNKGTGPGSGSGSKRRRSLLTTDRKVLEQVWDHAEETIRVYCNYPADSPQCRRVFHKGAKDTIIKLPHHIGEGPWARIVSMEPEKDLDSRDLPAWVRRKRALTNNRNGKFGSE